MTIGNIKKCEVCHGQDLITKKVLLDDFYGEPVERIVKICRDCETIHYIYNGVVFHEFSIKVNIGSGIQIEEDGN
jgi:hypothetical protein